MNEEKTTVEFIQHKNGFNIVESDLTTEKIVINNIEITSIEDWNKVTHSIVELQQENARLKDKFKDLEEWLEAMVRIYENEYKDVDASEHYKCMLHKLKEN